MSDAPVSSRIFFARLVHSELSEWTRSYWTITRPARRSFAREPGTRCQVMTARGYPVGDFDQRADDISVDHPNVVMNYRAAHDIAKSHAQGRASTEDLRQAMVHYRA